MFTFARAGQTLGSEVRKVVSSIIGRLSAARLRPQTISMLKDRVLDWLTALIDILIKPVKFRLERIDGQRFSSFERSRL